MHIPEEQSQHPPWEDNAVSRRDWLRKLALAGAGATGWAGVAPTVVEGKAMAPAPLAQTTGLETMWTHGASIQLETRALEASTARRGGFTTVVNTVNDTQIQWFHYAIPTPVVVAGRRATIDAVLVLGSTGHHAIVKSIHVWDGPNRRATFENLNLVGNHHPRKVIPNRPPIFFGIGLSVGVSFQSTDPKEAWVNFAGAGADFF